jgi:hypothetical protein
MATVQLLVSPPCPNRQFHVIVILLPGGDVRMALVNPHIMNNRKMPASAASDVDIRWFTQHNGPRRESLYLLDSGWLGLGLELAEFGLDGDDSCSLVGRECVRVDNPAKDIDD